MAGGHSDNEDGAQGQQAAGDPQDQIDKASAFSGVLFALAAFGTWGLLTPIYFKVLDDVPVYEILAHRIIWSVVVLGLIAVFTGQVTAVRKAFQSGRTLGFLVISTTFISVNWAVYIYAIQAGQTTEASLGYFITPLVNVLLGVLLFQERLSLQTRIAIGIAATGVTLLFIGEGTFAWLTLILAVCFAAYGATRKMAPVAALPGLLIETLIVSPLAIGYLLYEAQAGRSSFAQGEFTTDALIIASGVVTALPLLWFNEGAKRLTMTTLGLLQYLVPSMLFIVAITVFEEPLSPVRLACFALIWVALIVYTRDSLMKRPR